MPGTVRSGPAPAVLRVGASGDYPPFSYSPAAPGDPAWAAGLTGFDVAVTEAYARDRGLRVEWVPFRWPELLEGLAARRFDVAVGGVTVRPERSLAGRFTVPVARSGAVLLLPADSPLELPALEAGNAVLAVNAGGHLERVARERFPHATIRAISGNDRVLEQLDDPAVAAVVTDSVEAPRWEARRPGLRRLGPLTADHKAFLVHPAEPGLAADLDRWLLDKEAAGTLRRLRVESLDMDHREPVADNLSALVAATEERLALMPWVAAAKQLRGLPLEAPEREERVVAAGIRAAESEGPLSPNRRTAVERFFRAQIAAAREVQAAVLAAGPAPPAAPPDLDTVLRPALVRIGDRLGALLARPVSGGPLPPAGEVARSLAADPHLSESGARALAEAILAARADP